MRELTVTAVQCCDVQRFPGPVAFAPIAIGSNIVCLFEEKLEKY